MKVQTEAETWLRNKKRAVMVLQILFALGTIACGAVNLAMNSRDIGFKYTVNTSEIVTKRETNNDNYPRYGNHNGDASTTSTTTTKPPPVVTHRQFLLDKICWDNSGLWGGVVVLLTVLVTMRSAKSNCLSVTQSVAWFVGMLVCIATGVAATIWSDKALNNADWLDREYNNKFVKARGYGFGFSSKSTTTYQLESKENMCCARLVMVATISTAIFSYLNVILFVVPFFLGLFQEESLARKVFRARIWRSNGVAPCGVHLSLGSFVCRWGSFKANPAVDEPTTTEYRQLVEEVTSDRASLINEAETNPVV